MKKIALIIPPSPFLLSERVFPFLGILRVAAAWEKQGTKVDVIDLGGIENYLDVVRDYMDVNAFDIDFVGITFTTPQTPNAYSIAKYIKIRRVLMGHTYPEIKLVAGGSHTTLMHTAMKRGSDRARMDVERLQEVFDVLVCGDGEYTLEEILITEKGVIDVDDRTSPFFLTNQTFTESPNPARHLIDLSSYHYTIEGVKATSLIGQLGCSMQCIFCSGRNSPYLRKTRNRTTQSIIDEIEHLYLKYDYTGFMFYDDELNINKEMIPLMNSIADLGDKYGVEWQLRGFTKAELFTDAQAEAMVRAGFKVLLTGFESGDGRILKTIRKMATRDDNTRCVEIAKKHGLKVKALMSMGHAGESYESIENTKDWLLSVEPEDFDCTIITCYPGSPYFDDAVKIDDHYVFTSKDTGDKLYQTNINYTKDSDHYKGIPGAYRSYVWTDHLTSKELVVARDELENDVRDKLNIPFNPSNPTKKYEHSYGSSRNLPDWIVRSTK
mgnify:FL=1